jgi:hypothetical protein
MPQVDGRSYLSRGPVRLTREHLADSAADGCHDDQNVSVIHLRTQWY